MTSKTEEERVLSGAVWADFCDRLKAAGEVVMAPPVPGSSLDRAEGWRYLSRLTRTALDMMIEHADPDFPTFFSATDETIKIGGDNPDCRYLNATISGARTYRMRGTRGDAPALTIGTKANRLATEGTMVSTGEIDGRDMQFGPDGAFEIILSTQPQPGNWLPMAPDTSLLIFRETFLDRTRERPGHFEIACLDGPARPAPLAAETLAHGLGAAAAFVAGTARTFAGWAELFRAEPNQLPLRDQSLFQRVGGHPSIFYLHGYWQLAPDEALVIETEIPDCTYWNFVLQNYWMESNDYRYLPSYVNKTSAHYEPDGRVVLTVAAEDRGFANFLDTAGHAEGTMLLRWVGAKSHPGPTCRVVKLSDSR